MSFAPRLVAPASATFQMYRSSRLLRTDPRSRMNDPACAPLCCHPSCQALLCRQVLESSGLLTVTPLPFTTLECEPGFGSAPSPTADPIPRTPEMALGI